MGCQIGSQNGEPSECMYVDDEHDGLVKRLLFIMPCLFVYWFVGWFVAKFSHLNHHIGSVSETRQMWLFVLCQESML
jgi:hypothetical protein